MVAVAAMADRPITARTFPAQVTMAAQTDWVIRLRAMAAVTGVVAMGVAGIDPSTKKTPITARKISVVATRQLIL